MKTKDIAMTEKKDQEPYSYSYADTVYSEKLSGLYVNRDRCVTADLFRDEDGLIFIFWYWLTNHGIGPDHSSAVVTSVEELRESLLRDEEIGWVSKEDVERICRNCSRFFGGDTGNDD